MEKKLNRRIVVALVVIYVIYMLFGYAVQILEIQRSMVRESETMIAQYVNFAAYEDITAEDSADAWNEIMALEPKEGTVALVADAVSARILGATNAEYTGKSLAQIGISPFDYKKFGAGVHVSVNDTVYYAVFYEYDDLIYARMVERAVLYAHVEESVSLMPAIVAVLVIICGLGVSRYAYKNLTKPIVQTRDSLRRFVSGDMKETFAMDEVDYVELQQISGLLGQVQEMVENQQLQLKKHQDLVHIEAERADISAAAKRVFLTRISHDVRAPINGIIAMVALAEENIQDTVCVRDSLHRIENSGKQLLMMLNEVLDMSQIESGRADLKEEDFQLAEMIHDTIAALRPAAEARQHQLLLQVKNLTHEYVVGPKDRVKDIIDSIVENSIKYTPRGGVIRVTLTELDSEIRYAGVYQMTFEDNGIGISEEAVAHIFEPFGRAEDDQRAGGIQGAGLGLAIVKNIVQLMNGTIDVESEPESGSKFTVTIKLKLQKRAEGVATRVPKRSLAAVDEFFADRYKDKRVLVVEDNALNADVAAAALTQIGMEVETAVDGQQAVTRMQEVPENYFDLIFMDVQMPVMDGYIATQMIRNLRREDVKRMPIIGMTSLTQEASLDVALQAGMDEYVVKPLEPMRMKGLLQRWL